MYNGMDLRPTVPFLINMLKRLGANKTTRIGFHGLCAVALDENLISE